MAHVFFLLTPLESRRSVISLRMKNIIATFLFLIQVCVALAQNCRVSDSAFNEIHSSLTEHNTGIIFYYFNNEWIPEAKLSMVENDSISKIEVKDDEYGNRAIFITVSPQTLDKLKSDVREATKNLFINYDPICEFPGGNNKLKEWLDANIQIPEGYKGHEKVIVRFFVQPDGSVTDAKLLKPSKNDAVNTEALRLISILPKFRVKFCTPKRTRIGYLLSITFTEPGAVCIKD